MWNQALVKEMCLHYLIVSATLTLKILPLIIPVCLCTHLALALTLGVRQDVTSLQYYLLIMHTPVSTSCLIHFT